MARIIGATFLLWGLSYLLYNLPFAISTQMLVPPLFFMGRVAYDLGALAIAVFTCRVFRAGAGWARAVLALMLLSILIGLVSSAALGDWEGTDVRGNPWFWAEWLGITVPPVWMGVEGLLEYASARRRRTLGLCDPILCNRFLLWSLMGLFVVVSNLAVLPQYLEYQQAARFSVVWDAVLGWLEIFTVVVIWLVFWPPILYRRWIDAAAHAGHASEVRATGPSAPQ